MTLAVCTTALADELVDRQRDLRFSVASLWEVAIKRSLGRPGFTVDSHTLHQGPLREGWAELPIVVGQVLAVQTLPWSHRDPFDRQLVAAARREGLTLLSADRTLLGFGEGVRWVG